MSVNATKEKGEAARWQWVRALDWKKIAQETEQEASQRRKEDETHWDLIRQDWTGTTWGEILSRALDNNPRVDAKDREQLRAKYEMTNLLRQPSPAEQQPPNGRRKREPGFVCATEYDGGNRVKLLCLYGARWDLCPPEILGHTVLSFQEWFGNGRRRIDEGCDLRFAVQSDGYLYCHAYGEAGRIYEYRAPHRLIDHQDFVELLQTPLPSIRQPLDALLWIVGHAVLPKDPWTGLPMDHYRFLEDDDEQKSLYDNKCFLFGVSREELQRRKEERKNQRLAAHQFAKTHRRLWDFILGSLPAQDPHPTLSLRLLALRSDATLLCVKQPTELTVHELELHKWYQQNPGISPAETPLHHPPAEKHNFSLQTIVLTLLSHFGPIVSKTPSVLVYRRFQEEIAPLLDSTISGLDDVNPDGVMSVDAFERMVDTCSSVQREVCEFRWLSQEMKTAGDRPARNRSVQDLVPTQRLITACATELARINFFSTAQGVSPSDRQLFQPFLFFRKNESQLKFLVQRYAEMAQHVVKELDRRTSKPAMDKGAWHQYYFGKGFSSDQRLFVRVGLDFGWNRMEDVDLSHLELQKLLCEVRDFCVFQECFTILGAIPLESDPTLAWTLLRLISNEGLIGYHLRSFIQDSAGTNPKVVQRVLVELKSRAGSRNEDGEWLKEAFAFLSDTFTECLQGRAF